MLQCYKCEKESNNIKDFWVNFQCFIECLQCKKKGEKKKKVKNKEPWQMTRKEFVKSDNVKKIVYELAEPIEKLSVFDRTEDNWKELGKEIHKQSVIIAIEQDKLVPAEVLAEYPKLGEVIV